jgi:hypothetical protein
MVQFISAAVDLAPRLIHMVVFCMAVSIALGSICMWLFSDDMPSFGYNHLATQWLLVAIVLHREWVGSKAMKVLRFTAIVLAWAAVGSAAFSLVYAVAAVVEMAR